MFLENENVTGMATPGSPARDGVSCIRCNTPFTIPPFPIDWERLPGGGRRHRCGFVVTPRGALYCATCGPTLRFCHRCGCTDEAGCPEGCYWVGENECSACRTKVERARAIAR
jgi:hypothetical protein